MNDKILQMMDEDAGLHRRKKVRKPSANHESKLQQACVRWFRMQHRDKIMFAIPNGSFRYKATGAVLKAEGVISGIADLMLMEPRGEYHGMFIEMKAGKNKCTPEQLQFLKHATSKKYYCDVCYSFDEFKETVEKYLGL